MEEPKDEEKQNYEVGKISCWWLFSDDNNKMKVPKQCEGSVNS
jgi:hypothetical protein